MLVKVGPFKKVYSVMAGSAKNALDKAQSRAMREMPYAAVCMAATGAKIIVKISERP